MSSHPVAAAFAPRLTACLPPPPTHSQAPPAPGRCPRQSSSLRASSKSGTLHSLITSSAAIHSSSTPLQRNSQASAVVLLLLPLGLSVSATTWGGYARQAALAVHVASHVLSLVMCLDTPSRDRIFSGGCTPTSAELKMLAGKALCVTAVSSRCHRLTGPACPQSLRTWRQQGGRAGAPERRDRPPCQAKKAAARKCRSLRHDSHTH